MTHTRRSAIVLRHVAFEDLGLLATALDKAGWSASYREGGIDDLSDEAIAAADLLVVLGGPIGVYELETYPFLAQEIALLERRLARDLPTLGICLGAQLMAKALGARVFAGPVKEIGWSRVDLTPQGEASPLAPLADPQSQVLHWHGDTFDLPAGAVRLASSKHYENQAFAFGRNSLALQFHLEVDPGRLEQWFIGHAVELANARLSVVHLRTATAAVVNVVPRQAERIFGAWLGETGLGEISLGEIGLAKSPTDTD